MPQALPLTDLISQASSRTRMNRVMEAQFADGYSESTPDGLNPDYDVWDIEYCPLYDSERLTLWTVLNAVGASDYVTWQPPGYGLVRKWRVVKNSIKESQGGGGDLWLVSFQLTQTY